MILRDWEIWYSYSTYFLEEINDLGSVAKSLIQSDLCAVVFSSYHGVIWWKDDEEIKESKLDAKPDKTGNGFKVIFPKGIAGYAREEFIRPSICPFTKQKYLTRNISMKWII